MFSDWIFNQEKSSILRTWPEQSSEQKENAHDKYSKTQHTVRRYSHTLYLKRETWFPDIKSRDSKCRSLSLFILCFQNTRVSMYFQGMNTSILRRKLKGLKVKGYLVVSSLCGELKAACEVLKLVCIYNVYSCSHYQGLCQDPIQTVCFLLINRNLHKSGARNFSM